MAGAFFVVRSSVGLRHNRAGQHGALTFPEFYRQESTPSHSGAKTGHPHRRAGTRNLPPRGGIRQALSNAP